ncbi:CubicO group peptidase (beta-lactamase class C family) [Caulobacter ginsengisoli]|uniref:CubicO group peptidase (Beta-lactamase class C family) n=1 Tax=Caulobacter ginsengisoli TaxID=400775 RepID=A0ABU0IS73_9CAUL|nr:serine hydrolase domain-containing protein [Caulobacter ginsengisoli]MDQ0464858.1 CubicO group peptidase (beta-lactamase class C family) [Caulobacter ginsengisoli]
MSSPIQGTVAPGFEAVRAAFEANFLREGDYQELGAALAVYHRGALVADLWGGWADRARTRPWRRDSLINVWSATKGAVAVAVARLVDTGLLTYEDRVADHWPEFGQAGKGDTTVAQLMSHQAGLPGFAEPTSVDDQLDWAGCVGKLERQAPLWPPGEASSYHAMTYGWLAGELIRRVTGQTPGDFLAEQVAGPLGADIFVGLPPALEDRVAEIVGPTAPLDEALLAALPPAALMALSNPQQDPESPNRREWRAAQVPAANGHASALGLAKLYAALVFDGLDGVRVLSAGAVRRMLQPAVGAGRVDMFLGFDDCWSMGMALNRPGIYGPNSEAYGHSGWGGSFGCADPDAEVAIGYVCNRMGPELVGDPRTGGLCEAVLGAAKAR